jgi:hypothetical protein
VWKNGRRTLATSVLKVNVKLAKRKWKRKREKAVVDANKGNRLFERMVDFG